LQYLDIRNIFRTDEARRAEICSADMLKGLFPKNVIGNIPPQPFYSPFSGTTGWPSARRQLLDFMVHGKINRGRHTDHPAFRLGATLSGL